MKLTLAAGTAQAMERLGRRLAGLLAAGDVVYLGGVMGSGKTTLVRGIAQGLGYGRRISSPTFTLLNIYDTSPVLYHMDFYRLAGEDFTEWDLNDYAAGVMLIEWPEAGAGMIPAATWTIAIGLTGEDYDLPRTLTITTAFLAAPVQEELSHDFSH
jgi:tRNA threonylcarbamoyladenosine biosynthesis protein TsaE